MSASKGLVSWSTVDMSASLHQLLDLAMWVTMTLVTNAFRICCLAGSNWTVCIFTWAVFTTSLILVFERLHKVVIGLSTALLYALLPRDRNRLSQTAWDIELVSNFKLFSYAHEVLFSATDVILAFRLFNRLTVVAHSPVETNWSELPRSETCFAAQPSDPQSTLESASSTTGLQPSKEQHGR